MGELGRESAIVIEGVRCIEERVGKKNQKKQKNHKEKVVGRLRSIVFAILNYSRWRRSVVLQELLFASVHIVSSPLSSIHLLHCVALCSPAV